MDTATQAMEYFLGDALDSARKGQLTNSTGEVTFAQGYAPYVSVVTTSGNGESRHGFTNVKVMI